MKSGFTLLELIVTVALIMAVAGTVMTGKHYNDERILRNAVLVLHADIQYAQRKAVTEGRRTGIQFDAENNRYHVMTNEPEFQIFRTVMFSGGVELLSSTHERERITYLPRGTGNPGTLMLRNGQFTQRITTTFSGGQVIIHELVDGG